MIVWTIPLKTVSEANCSEHWSKKSKRHRQQQFYIRSLFAHEAMQITLPCTVTLIRLSPRMLDDDNLRSAFKWIRDEISECILPEKVKFYQKKGKLYILKGHADSDSRITWVYGQEKQSTLGIRIEIEEKQ